MAKFKKRVERITHADVEKAVRVFLRRGGLVTKLPDQPIQENEFDHVNVALRKFGWTDLAWKPNAVAD